MNTSRLDYRCLWVAALVSGLCLMASACSRNGKPAAMASTSFASAPTDVQKNWEAAGECAAGNDYLGAVTNLTLVFSNAPRLTAEQNAALEQAWLEIGNRAFRAGEKGDKNAVKAVLQMRASPFGKVKGER